MSNPSTGKEPSFSPRAAAPAIAPLHGFATIALSSHQSAQGPVLHRYRNGRVVIDTGREHLTGRPLGLVPPKAPVWAPLFAGMF